VIIGLTGTIGAGKGTVVEYLLQHKNFRHYSARSFISEELNKRNLELTRDNMALVADELRNTNGASYIIDTLLDEAVKNGGDAIIESIRTIGELESLRNKASNFYLFAVDADPKLRYERIVKRNSSTDHVDFKKFMEDEANESFHAELWRMNLPACIERADHVFINNSTVEELFKEVETVIGKLA
jgi:dephospho-CoA kinase